MALVQFAGRRVGFWVVARGISASEELPEGVPVRVSGAPAVDQRALVVAAADEGGSVAWAALVHADGAALLMEWRGRLLAAIGPRAVLLGPGGEFLAERLFEVELVTSWSVPDGLLLLGRGRAWLVDERLVPRWTRPLAGDHFHLLSAGDEGIRLAALGASDWHELLLDPRTGAELATG